MASYNIPREATLHLVVRLRGGAEMGVPFVDVSSPRGPRRIAWNTNAPAGRIAWPGLCIEGRCKNRSCEAGRRNSMVIHNAQFRNFDVLYDRSQVVCPLCCSPLVPELCAFNNCRYKFYGVKLNPLTRNAKRVSCAWRTAGEKDAYQRFEPASSGIAHWIRLVLEARPVGYREELRCMVCLEEVYAVQEGDQENVVVGNRSAGVLCQRCQDLHKPVVVEGLS
ncbi:hypothetical protein HK104_003208 [Borealophlyctis nickersoniae]|nr:hypothetical protein HK104_003208 [Borealophlyctis nickersoniae]